MFHYNREEIMQFAYKNVARSIGAITLVAAFVMVGCTPKVTEEQLTKLRELRAESARLTTDIQKKDAEKVRIDAELARRRAEAKECADKLAFVQDKISKWPNVWPDYDPNAPIAPPPPAPEPVKAKGKKK